MHSHRRVCRGMLVLPFVLAFLLGATPALGAVWIPAGRHYGVQYTATLSGGEYFGWHGVDGYITPPNPRINQNHVGDHSLSFVNMKHPNHPIQELQWAQTGYAKKNPDTNNHIYIYTEKQDRYGYWGFAYWTSEGDQLGTAAKAFYSYYHHYNPNTGSYVTQMDVKYLGNTFDEAYFLEPWGRADGTGEALLVTGEWDYEATQIGRSWFGSDTVGHEMHLLNGSDRWELWDNSLTAGTTAAHRELEYGYIWSPHDQWYHFRVNGPGN